MASEAKTTLLLIDLTPTLKLLKKSRVYELSVYGKGDSIA